MKACIVNPYLDTLGGGERYTMGVAKALAKAGYKVDIEWKDRDIVDKLQNRFGLKLENIAIVKTINRGDNYDVCFWVSDGSIPLLRARTNLLHFQVPFHDVNGKSLINRMKLTRVKTIICNSRFTKSFIDEEFGIDSVVLYPPIETASFKPRRKQNLILFVGRFSGLLQSKGQDVLINAFKEFYKKGYRHWKLVLAGGTEVGVGDYLESLRKLTKGYPVEILESPKFSEMKSLYGKAKLFWSASGFGVDERKNPERVEHFGISVVEAMASGAVPIIYEAGGHKETVEDGRSGYLWQKTSKLISYSQELAENSSFLEKMARSAQDESKKFETQKFEREFLALI